MKKYKETYIIGIDHGYGNIKTANCCFQAGVTVYDKEPIFKDNQLVWNNKYYLISAEHKDFQQIKCWMRIIIFLRLPQSHES